MGCGASRPRDVVRPSPSSAWDATTSTPEGKAHGAVGSPASGRAGAQAKAGEQQHVSRCTAAPGSRYVRLIMCLPFRRSAAAEELLLRCCLPRVRDYCRQRGWTLLPLGISDETDPDLLNARPDTMYLCRRELDRCHRLSAGPSMLTLLDRWWRGSRCARMPAGPP